MMELENILKINMVDAYLMDSIGLAKKNKGEE